MLILIWVLIAYGMTNILVWGSIFESTRTFIKKHSKFFGDLISCTLCTATWVGFFLSLVLGGLTNHYFNIPWYICLFMDGMLTTGGVWFINSAAEFLEENRPK
jgi:MFS family permease